LGCEHIKEHGNYYTSTRPEGDNKTSIVIYKDTLISSCHTLGILDVDIITLIEKLKDCYFSHAIKWICDTCGWDYYSKTEKVSNELLDWLDKIESKTSEIEDEEIKSLSNQVLNEYFNYPNKWLHDEGIDIQTQIKWEIHYDLLTNSIVYPIRDELGSLVGVKCRCLDNIDSKFLALYKYPKSKILYGLNQNFNNIKAQNEVILVEAEKGVLKLENMGFSNVIALGGKTPSETQLNKILKLNAPICWALDKDVWKKNNRKSIDIIINDIKIFTEQYVVYDKWGKTSEKDSPYDKGLDTWKFLYKNKFAIK